MHKTEDHHHTAEQVSGYLQAALSICDESDLAHDERIAVLPALLTILSSKQVFYTEGYVAPRLDKLGGRR